MAGAHRRVRIPFSGAPAGTCRWCGDPILHPDGRPDRRRRWHQHPHDPRGCLAEYRLTWGHRPAGDTIIAIRANDQTGIDLDTGLVKHSA